MHNSPNTDISVWSPVCVEHGFSDAPFFTDPKFKVEGFKVSDIVGEFVKSKLSESSSKKYWLVD